MTLSVACPKCGKNLKAKREYVGKNAKCSGCQHAFKIEAPSPAPEPDVAAPDLSDLLDEALPQQPAGGGTFVYCDACGQSVWLEGNGGAVCESCGSTIGRGQESPVAEAANETASSNRASPRHTPSAKLIAGWDATRQGLTLLYYGALGFASAMLLMLVFVAVSQATIVGSMWALIGGGVLLFGLWWFDEPFLPYAIGFVFYGLLVRACLSLNLGVTLNAIGVALAFATTIAVIVVPFIADILLFVGTILCYFVPRNAKARSGLTLSLSAAVGFVMFLAAFLLQIFVRESPADSAILWLTVLMAIFCVGAMDAGIILALRAIAEQLGQEEVRDYVTTHFAVPVAFSTIGVLACILEWSGALATMSENVPAWVVMTIILITWVIACVLVIGAFVWFSRCIDAVRSIIPTASKWNS